ncbi:MAG: hypothetical protein ABIJ34_02000 [archaeon]
MKEAKDIISFYVLGLFLLLYFFSLFYENNFIMLLVVLASTVFLIKGFSILHELPSHKRYGFIEHKMAVFMCTIGSVATYFLSGYLGVALAASIIGLLGYYISKAVHDKDTAPAVYAGAFVGMSSTLVLPNIFIAGVAGFFAGLLYYLSHDSYIGVGGKLGTIAFSGVALTVTFLILWGLLI